MGNRLQKKSSRNPRADPHLPRLQYDVLAPAPSLKLLLCAVHNQRYYLSFTITDAQPAFRQEKEGWLMRQPFVPFLESLSHVEQLSMIFPFPFAPHIKKQSAHSVRKL